jgi:hypothetical protein
MFKRYSQLLFVVLALMLVFGNRPTTTKAAYLQGDANADINISHPISTDAFIAVNSLSVNSLVGGELFAAANNLTINKKSDRSIFGVGNVVNINSGSSYDTFIAGNEVTLSGDFAQDVYVLGNDVTLNSNTDIHGDLKIYANRVYLDGKIAGGVEISAGYITSQATIGGNFNTLGSNQLTFKGGSIGNGLSYLNGTMVNGLDTVNVTGDIKVRPVDTSKQNQRTYSDVLAGLVYAMFSLFILGGALILFAPKKMVEIEEVVLGKWSTHFWRGLLTLIVAPIMAMVLLMTMIGWRVALVVFLFYMLMLLLTTPIAMFIFGGQLMQKLHTKNQPNMWLDLIVGVLVVSIFTALPYIGWALGVIFFFAFSLPTLGAMLFWWRDKVV